MADNWGIKASQLGYDVTTAADQQLLFSSSWPLLKTHIEGRFTIADQQTPQLIVAHGLGYIPAFLYNDISGSNSELFGYYSIGPIYVNSTGVYYDPSFTIATGPRDIYIRIFRYNIKTNYTAPIIQTATATQAVPDPTYTFKVSKTGKDVSSTDLRDFAIHSDSRSPLIHQSVYGTLVASTDGIGGYELKATHGLPYPPIFLAYTNNSYSPAQDRWCPIFTGSGGSWGIFTTPTSVKYGASVNNGEAASIIVFKDPFIIENSTDVTI